MKKLPFLLLFALISFFQISGQVWRSSLYPVGWRPGYKDIDGKFLHDFSYAGYHAGEKEIPFITENIIDITKAPFNADTSGVADVTGIIQNALDSVGKAGGGVVFLPEGTYKIVAGASYALWIKYSNVVLRGAGKTKTFVFNDNPSIRLKNIILIKPISGGDWYSPEGSTQKLDYDVENQENMIAVPDAGSFTVGDWIVLTTDVTAGFIADHKMTGNWNSTLPGVAFYRQIKDIDIVNNKITLDVPVRYYLNTRDNARIYKVNKHLEEVGIENLSIASRQNMLTGWADMDYNVNGTGAYDVHGSQLISFYFTVNSWMKNVSTYKPIENTGNYHVNSNAILLEKSRFITIDSCYMGFSQYEGEGGNGYMYTLRGNECLIKNSIGDNGRHNFDFKSMFCSGNVILRCTGKDSRLASDFHMHLSMANLIDNHTVDNDMLEAAYRPYGTILHGQTTTESVFWNTTGKKAQGGGSTIIKSQQWGWGYIIGTQGTVTGVSVPGGNNTEPIDVTEGIGKGATLQPASLYEDQLRLRLKGYETKIEDHSYIIDDIKIFPNPVQNQLTIDSGVELASVGVYNSNGNEILFITNIKSKQCQLQLNNFVSGYYILKIMKKNGAISKNSFMKINYN